VSIYKELELFIKGEADEISVKHSDDDRVVRITHVNEKSLGKSIVLLSFYEEDYVRLFMPDNEYDQNRFLINVAFSRYGYSDNVFIDSSYADDDFREGYIFRYFNKENDKTVQKILDMVSPDLNIKKTDDHSEIAKVLIQLNEYSCSQIAYEWASYYDIALVRGMREYVVSKLCNKFFYLNFFEKTCAESYITTVQALIDFFDENDINKDSESMLECLKKYVEDNDLYFDDDLYEDYYAYYDDKNFDDEGFQREVERELEKIYEKLTDDLEEGSLQKNFELINYVRKLGYDFGRTYNFPKEKNYGTKTGETFRLGKVEDGKIIVVVSNQKMKMNLEDFKNFLFHPELF